MQTSAETASENSMSLHDTLITRILETPRKGRRRLVALAGAPASGKSTLAEQLARDLTNAGCAAQVIPMDGFHLHNPTLIARNMLDRKGAPETFDASGFVNLVKRLHDETEVYYPTFDRARDIAIAGAGCVDDTCDTAIIEGNYLLYDAPVWRDLAGHWDISIRLETPIDILKKRLIDRWVSHGLTLEQATARTATNDLPNAQLVTTSALPADVIL
ncbi:nucleoside/nucleotide kinase family protein [Sulfitobacter geojensis]|uniref:nucleoside/nucleotide kinase family protein n=1 Tax=Sulfitobacter geojensis TaxID=1342299 RepID=UPI00249248F5|nr:nucleoside/nucleotide kinase family protein [Sulfitobacter geojensis]